jgi:hypothetical protein
MYLNIKTRKRGFLCIISSTTIFCIFLFLTSTTSSNLTIRKLLQPRDGNQKAHWCSTTLWTHVPSQLLTPPIRTEIEKICNRLHPLPVHPLWARLDTVRMLSVERPKLWQSFFSALVEDSSVEVVIGSRDRAAALHKVLSLLQPPRVSGLRTTVLYSGSEHSHISAYASLAEEFRNITFVDRGLEKNSYFLGLLKVLRFSKFSLFMV